MPAIGYARRQISRLRDGMAGVAPLTADSAARASVHVVMVLLGDCRAAVNDGPGARNASDCSSTQ